MLLLRYVLLYLLIFAGVLVYRANFGWNYDNSTPEDRASRITEQVPIVSASNGYKNFYQENEYDYTLEFGSFALYEQDRVVASDVRIIGMQVTDLPEPSANYEVIGENLETDDGNLITIQGEESIVNMWNTNFYNRGVGEMITFNVREQWARLSAQTKPVETYHTHNNGRRVYALSTQADFYSERDEIVLSENVNIRYIYSDLDTSGHYPGDGDLGDDTGEENIILTGDAASVVQNRLSITGNVKIQHTSGAGNNRRVIDAESDEAYYIDDNRILLTGDVNIQDGTNNVDAEEVVYDTASGSWTLSNQNRNPSSGESSGEGGDPVRVNIQIER